MSRHGVAALALVILAGAAFAPAGTVTPALARATKYLDDRAGVFEESRALSLNEKLAAFERSTSNQVVVVVERRLPEEISIEELANRTFREWKIGQKGGSNGVLFLVFIDDRKMRLEVGYGLEGAIPDARAHRITDEIVNPLHPFAPEISDEEVVRRELAARVGDGAREAFPFLGQRCDEMVRRVMLLVRGSSGPLPA